MSKTLQLETYDDGRWFSLSDPEPKPSIRDHRSWCAMTALEALWDVVRPLGTRIVMQPVDDELVARSGDHTTAIHSLCHYASYPWLKRRDLGEEISTCSLKLDQLKQWMESKLNAHPDRRLVVMDYLGAEVFIPEPVNAVCSHGLEVPITRRTAEGVWVGGSAWYEELGRGTGDPVIVNVSDVRSETYVNIAIYEHYWFQCYGRPDALPGAKHMERAIRRLLEAGFEMETDPTQYHSPFSR